MNLFFYGTLKAEQVRQAVLGTHHATLRIVPATLTGYEVRQVAGALYPMIVASDHANIVSGLIIYDVDSESLALLDRFEGVHYQRAQVGVMTENSEEQAEIYIPDDTMIPAGLWDFDSWVNQDMARFFAEDFAPEGVARPRTDGEKDR